MKKKVMIILLAALVLLSLTSIAQADGKKCIIYYDKQEQKLHTLLIDNVFYSFPSCGDWRENTDPLINESDRIVGDPKKQLEIDLVEFNLGIGIIYHPLAAIALPVDYEVAKIKKRNFYFAAYGVVAVPPKTRFTYRANLWFYATQDILRTDYAWFAINEDKYPQSFGCELVNVGVDSSDQLGRALITDP